MNDLYSIKLNVGETLTASRLAKRARKTAHANARARTEVSPNPFNTTRTNVLPPVMAKLDFVKQMLKPKNTYRFANPRWHKLAFDPLPGGNYVSDCPSRRGGTTNEVYAFRNILQAINI